MKAICVTMGVAAVVLALAGAASADVIYSENFETGFGSGYLGGSNGWSGTSPVFVGTGGALGTTQVLTTVDPAHGLNGSSHSLAPLDPNVVTMITVDTEHGSNTTATDGSNIDTTGTWFSWQTVGTGWRFSTSLNGGFDTYPSKLADNVNVVGFKLVLDGVNNTYSASYNAGSGYQLINTGDLTDAQILAINGLAITANSRGTCSPMGIDNILVTNTIPEPGTLVLIGCGVLSLLAYAWRKQE
jgi:hypothetical protein